MAKTIKVTAGNLTRRSVIAADHVQEIISAWLKSEGKRIAALAADLLADSQKITNVARADAMLKKLGLGGFDDLVDKLQPSLAASYKEASHDMLEETGSDTAAHFSDVNTDAADWARNRAAEMVGQMYVDDELVTNPDPHWAITDATRDNLRGMIVDAIENGMTPAQLANKIETSYDFSEGRSKVIANTEISRAQTEGALDGAIRSGVISGKEWMLSPTEHDTDDECDDNADDGVILLDELFSSGDNAPPAHPNCTCSLLFNLDGE